MALDRRAFVAELMASVPDDTLCVSGLGSPSYDLYAAGDRDTNFYLWGAMGAAVPLGLGLALAQPTKPVLVLTGDGEHLMGIGSLATVTTRQPPNLSIVVLDNGHYGETGMQKSHTSHGTDLAAVARGFGIPTVHEITTPDQTPLLAKAITEGVGPVYARVQVDNASPPRALPYRDGVHLKNRFRAALGLEPF